MNNGNGNLLKKRGAIIFGVGIAVSLVALTYVLLTRGSISTDDAFVDGHIFSITPRVSGYINSIFVSDNQTVSKGQQLVSLDTSEYEVSLAEAKANLAETESTLTSLELGVPLELTQTEQKVKSAESELNTLRKNLETKTKEEEAAAHDLNKTGAEHEKSLLDFKRMSELIKNHAISQAQMDETETKVRTTAALREAAQARLEGVKKQKAAIFSDMDRIQANIKLAATGEDLAGIRTRHVEAQKARVELARARLEQAQLNLSYCKIVSPTSGQVTRKKVEPGLMVSKGQPLMAVVPINHRDLWITANYKETEVTKVRPGQPVKIKVDTYPGLELKGVVESIMAGTGAAFSLFPPENASGNYVKIVQRIPVKIVLNGDENGALPQLRIGMSVIPTIYTDR